MGRIIRIGLAALMIGAIATVLSAWICAIVIDTFALPTSDGYRMSYDCPPQEEATVYAEWAAFFEPSGIGYTGTTSWWLDAGVGGEVFAPDERGDPAAVLPWWFADSQPTTPSNPPGRHSRSGSAYGWPFVSLWFLDSADTTGDVDPVYFDRGEDGIRLWKADRSMQGGRTITQRIVLPLRPIWTGFAICTAFYAIVVGLPLLACLSFVGRRCGRIIGRRRLKRGRCPKCRYDISGSNHENCPECGIVLS